MTETNVAVGDGRRRWVARGLLRAAPGLIVPALLFAWSIAFFAQEMSLYYSLPAAQRSADGDPIPDVAGPFLASLLIVGTLLLFVAPLLAGLPPRLRVWQAVVAVVLQVLLLWIAYAASGESRLGWLAFVGFAYVPALVVARLAMQARSVPRGSVSEGHS